MRDERGVTLLELVIGLAIWILVLTLVISCYMFILRQEQEELKHTQIRQHARIAAEEITNELRWAKIVSIENEGRAVRYVKSDAGADKEYRMYLAGGQLLVRFPNGGALPLAQSIESLLFEPACSTNPGNLISFEITAAENGLSYKIRGKVKPRNWR